MAQRGIRFGPSGTLEPDTTDNGEGVFLPVDRDVTRQWERAKSLAEEGRYSDAATLLDEILQRNDDYFIKPQLGKTTYRSLKADAQALIGKMPIEGRKAYELEFGARAQKLLSAAAASGDVNQLEEIARRYYHTQAGYQATLLLARHQLDHDHPLAAALGLERLLEAPAAADALEPSLSFLLATSWLRGGMADRARDVLVALKKKDPNATLTLAGQSVPLFAEDRQAIAWLEANGGEEKQTSSQALPNWAVTRGDAARNAVSDGGLPVMNPRWRVSTTNQPVLETALKDMRQRYLEQGAAALPTMQPLAVGNLVLMRDTRDLWAIDFNTGKRLWRVRSGGDVTLEQLLGSTNSGMPRFDPQNNPFLIERFWEDATFGNLASDGQRVYFLDELDNSNNAVPDELGAMGNPFMLGGRRGAMRGRNGFDMTFQMTNKISAHELRTQGKLKWQVGGQSGEDEPKLAGAFFLGVPLPLDGKLYVLAEMKSGEIKLCVLDAKTGRLDWTQQLAVVEQNLQIDPFRRLAGCTPSYADGVLVCPTGIGALVAVDIVNRTLLWGYQYPRNMGLLNGSLQLAGQIRRGAFQVNPQMQMNAYEHWEDANPVVGDGYVLATPQESDQLLWLSLLDGKELLTQPRGENLYVGGIHHGTTVVVGKHQVSLIALATAKSTNKSVPLPVGAMPSGRGFMSGDDYYLPLSTAEVVRIDLNTAQITASAKSRKGYVPGNLICHDGQIISQGVDFVEAYFQLESLQDRIAKTLAEHPGDPWALAHRGEIALDAGRIDDAIADIRQAYQADDSPLNRDLMIDALRVGLTKDFAKHRNDLHDLEQLVKLDSERAMFLRVLATGLQKSGEKVSAVDAFLKITQLESQPDELDDDEVDAKLLVNRLRWVRVQFESLWPTATAAQQTQITAMLQKWVTDAAAAHEVKSLRRFVACFGAHPLGDRARELLVAELNGPETALEREQLLDQLAKSSEPARRWQAITNLASLFDSAGQTDAARAEYRRLEADAGTQEVLSGKNVQQILAALPSTSPLRHTDVQSTPQWLEGAVKVEKNTAINRAQTLSGHTRLLPIEIANSNEPLFRNLTVGFDQQRNEIVGRDGLGRDKLHVSLNETGRGMMYPVTSQSDTSAMASGHVLVVNTGYQLLGLDALRSPESTGTRVLWQHELVDASVISNNGSQPVATSWGAIRRVPSLQIGDVGPCTENALCLMQGRDVTALDPRTGNTLWVRHGLEPASEVFGDNEITIIAPTASPKPATVLRTSDGKLLGERVLTGGERWLNYGRFMLVFRAKGDGNVVLALYDPWGQRDVWMETFAGWTNQVPRPNDGNNPFGAMNAGNNMIGGVKGARVDSETVALMEPGGRFVILNLADGRHLVEEKLEAEPALMNIIVQRSAGQDILIINHPPAQMTVRNQALQMQRAGVYQGSIGENSTMVSGHVYAFDRTTGRPQWPAPAVVDQQGLMLSVPAELPVLVFMRANITPPNRSKFSILCIDKRSGRAVLEDEDIPQFNGFDATGNSEQQSVELLCAPQPTITLKYTNTPQPPEPPYQPGALQTPPAKEAAAKTN
ncbi:MAG TPA: PQQ-binding-like beta-propeller repeat protein [Pirellulales bacterium]